MLQTPQSSQTTHIQDICEVCDKHQATVVCLSCSLLGFKFCAECDNKEHNRQFRPVQLHRRVPIEEIDLSVSCTNHRDHVATMFSEQVGQFACSDCQQALDWSQRETGFESLVTAASRLREKAGQYHHVCRNSIATLSETHRLLDNSLVKLTESVSISKTNIQQEFSRLIQILQQRQQLLISRTDKEVRIIHKQECQSRCLLTYITFTRQFVAFIYWMEDDQLTLFVCA